jgi:hypothetical protein
VVDHHFTLRNVPWSVHFGSSNEIEAWLNSIENHRRSAGSAAAGSSSPINT